MPDRCGGVEEFKISAFNSALNKGPQNSRKVPITDPKVLEWMKWESMVEQGRKMEVILRDGWLSESPQMKSHVRAGSWLK